MTRTNLHTHIHTRDKVQHNRTCLDIPCSAPTGDFEYVGAMFSGLNTPSTGWVTDASQAYGQPCPLAWPVAGARSLSLSSRPPCPPEGLEAGILPKPQRPELSPPLWVPRTARLGRRSRVGETRASTPLAWQQLLERPSAPATKHFYRQVPNQP